jgi:hypothetical protein
MALPYHSLHGGFLDGDRDVELRKEGVSKGSRTKHTTREGGAVHRIKENEGNAKGAWCFEKRIGREI